MTCADCGVEVEKETITYNGRELCHACYMKADGLAVCPTCESLVKEEEIKKGKL